MASKRSIAMVLPVAVWALMVGATAAFAGTAHQGDDISYGYDSNHRVAVCDQESDGRGVHADFETFAGTDGRVDDQDGSGGYCWGTERYGSGIYRHRTVEEIDTWPDAKSDWSYHD
jgi:hypothetical protein